MAKPALDGIRVLSFGMVWAGPLCAAMLGDMGAQVIQLESRTRPDPYRFMLSPDMTTPERGPLKHSLSRNCLSISLNMAQPKAREMAGELIKISDVMIDNYTPGVLKAWGLDYAQVKEINPRIIQASMSGWGNSGPMAPEPAYGPSISAYSGLGALIGYEGEPPLGEHTAYNDPASAMVTFFAIMAALYDRGKTGEGQFIDSSEWEAVNVLMGKEILDYSMNRRSAVARGNRHPWMAPHGCYRCQGEDNWVSIACATQEEWEALCTATGNPQWIVDDRFADMYCRLTNKEELDKIITGWTANHTYYEVMEILQNAGVAAVPVFSAEALFVDPHTQAQEYFVHVPHPLEPGEYVFTAPWKMSETQPIIHRHAPLLGEHNEYVFCELLRIPKEELARLIEEKVVY
jgi:benzylsuccinate CoA-transferase BbsF subunit